MTSTDASAASELGRVEAALAERIPTRIVPDLDRIRDMLDLLGSPQRAYPSIHVAGTNGKSSTTRMIDALLRAFGLRSGRYTSPHLESVLERIAVDGAPVSVDAFAAAYDDVAPYAGIVDGKHADRVTYYEMLTAMAFAHFADVPVDVAVIEVGLGGRWDATNVLEAPVAVITPIGLDHTEYLGDTLGAIAAEKAAILTDGATLVAAGQPPEAASVLLARAATVGAAVAREGVEFGVLERRLAVGGQLLTLRGIGGDYDEILLPLFGGHQASNAACALTAVEAFLGGGQQRLDIEAVREGLAAADSPGRLEVVRTSPTIVLDAAHNPAGAAVTAAAVAEAFSFTRLAGVLGVLADKDARGILEALEPLLQDVVCTTPESERALPAAELGRLAEEVFGSRRVRVEPALPEALDAAITLSEEDAEYAGSGVLVTGSIVTVGAARRLLRRRAR